MPDPQVLYIVTAVVVLGLVAWVVVVLSRGAKPGRPSSLREGAGAGVAEVSAGLAAASPSPAPSRPETALPAASEPASSQPRPPSVRPKLDPHLEIQDARPAPEVVEDADIDEPTGPLALILVTAVGRTDPGLKRKHNEDAYVILEDHHLFVIADGMGRHAAGEVASQLCVEAISEAFNKGTTSSVPVSLSELPKRATQLRDAILLANERILAAAQDNEAYAGMGTTVVGAYFSPNNRRVYIAHVGDSRCYRLRSGKLTQLTTDHTLGAAGIVGKSAAVLSRAVGVEDSVDVDVTMESPIPGDIYLLCSDGLSRMVNNEEMLETLTSVADLESATKRLIDTANARGGRDNITTILVRVDDARIPTGP